MSASVTFVICPSYRWFMNEATARFSAPGISMAIRYGAAEVTVNGHKYKYISSPDRMRGYRGVQVEWWGPAPAGTDNQEWAAVIYSVTLP